MSRLLLLTLALLPASVGLAQDEGQAQEPPSPAATKPRSTPSDRLIRQAFQGALTPEQLKALGPRATPDQLRDAMTPEQKSAARAGLATAEAKATTPDELKEIARGYLMLDEDAPDQGQQALRIAQTLQAANPQDSEGFSLAGSAAYQMGDYPAATEWAQHALKVNPNDERARAVYMLSKDRIKRGAGSAPGVTGTAAGPDGITAASAEFTIPERHDIAPQAIGFVRQAIAERRLGHMAETWANVQAAMNADPTSKTVQKLYGMAKEDQASYADTKELLRLSGDALGAGREQEALALAQRAYERSGHHPTVGKILEIAQQRAEERARQDAKKDLEAAAKKNERKGLHPLTAAAMMTGVLLLAWAATPQETKDHFKRVLWDNPAQELKLGAAALAAAAVFYGGWQLLAASAAASAPVAPVTGELALAGAGASAGGGAGVSGGALGTAAAWEQAALAALKSGTITLATMMGIKAVADRPRAQQRGNEKAARTPNDAGSPSTPSQPGPIPVPVPIPIGTKPSDGSCSIKPSEDLLLRFVDGTRLAPRFLDKHEEAGGHTKAMHVEKKIAFLVSRLPKKPGASSFPDQDTAESIIRQTVAMNEPAIRAWASQPPPVEPEAFFYSGTDIIGYGVTREKPALPQNKTNARTVLHLMKDCRILILTAYPE